MLIAIHPQNPSERAIQQIVKALQQGQIIIYPTDTVYGIGCDMLNKSAIDKLCAVIGKKPEEANLTLICRDLSNLSEYTIPFSNRVYKVMRRCLPGPFTFILKSNNNVPKLFKNKKKTIGIRVPDNTIVCRIVEGLGNPIVNASLHNEDSPDYLTDPSEIQDLYGSRVGFVIDGGAGGLIGSTVVDCSNDEIEIIRQGAGDAALLA